MKRFIALVKAICGKLFYKFVEGRLLAELPGLDEMTQQRIDHPSDDPRNGPGLPMVGIFGFSKDRVRGGQYYSA